MQSVMEKRIEQVALQLLESSLVTSLQLGVLSRSDKEKNIILKAEEFLESCGQYSASPNSSNQDEFFDGWLPLTMNIKKAFTFTTQELLLIRNASRIICATNEIMKNTVKHYRNFVIGDSLLTYIIPYDDERDPSKLKNLSKDPKVNRLHNNWRSFLATNNMSLRLNDWIDKVHEDGEFFLRVFGQGKTKDPIVRGLDPWAVDSESSDDMGVITKAGDDEAITDYMVRDFDTNKFKKHPADRVIHDKRNVRYESRRGIPSGWPIFANLRRLEKLLINTSILSSIHSAIAFVRTFDGANQARVQALMSRENDGKTRTNTITGRDINAKAVAPGTILNASSGMKYEFPAHNVDPSKWVSVMDRELNHIAAGRLLPVSWLLGNEPTEPLTPGSPVIANFRSERATVYTHLIRLFWMVQECRGENVDKLREKYEVSFTGPRLAVGKSLDEARVDDLNLKNGATSPQAIAAKNGERWEIVRSQVMQHRDTAMPNEVMPGDSGNANPQGSGSGDNGGDGLTKKGNKGQRGGDAGGGNNNV